MKHLRHISYFIISALLLNSTITQPMYKSVLPEKASIKTMLQSGCATGALFVGLVGLKNYRAQKEYERKQTKIQEANDLLRQINDKVYWQWEDEDKQLATDAVDKYEREYAHYQELLGAELQKKWKNIRFEFRLYHETYTKNSNCYSYDDFRRLRNNLWTYQMAVAGVIPQSPQPSHPQVFGLLGFIAGGLGYLAAIKYLFT